MSTTAESLAVASIDRFCTFLYSYTVWLWAVENFGNVAILYTVPWSFLIEPALLGCIVVTVQLFCVSFFAPLAAPTEPLRTLDAYRVYLISARQKILPSVITGFALISWGKSSFTLGLQLRPLTRFRRTGFSIGATIEIEVLNRDPLRFVEWDYGVAIWFSSAV